VTPEPPGEPPAGPEGAAPRPESAPDDDDGAEWRTWSGRSVNP
jgi:DNA-binding protein H-NS